jgi:hypothetical protein
MEDRGLSMPDAMKIAGIKSRNTMKRLIVEGIVQAERLPSSSGRGHWRIAKSSILALFEGTTRQQALALLRGVRL